MNLKEEHSYSRERAIVADELGISFGARYELSRVAEYIECRESDVKKLILTGEIRVARSPRGPDRVFGSQIIDYLFGHISSERIVEVKHPSESRLLKIGEVALLTSLSRSTIDLRESEGNFPSRVKLSARRVAWHETEVLDWIAQRAKNL